MDFGGKYKIVKSTSTSETAKIIDNRELTKWIRRGCSFSSLLFNSVLEILKTDIRQEEEIAGIKIKKRLISQEHLQMIWC